MSQPHGSSSPVITLVDLLRRRASEAPRELLFSWLHDSEAAGEVRLTRGELDLRARALAARLQDRNLTGSTAILLFPPGLETIVSFFGCLYAGVIAVPAHVPRPNRPMIRLRSIVTDSAPRALLTCQSLSANTARWYEEMAELKDLELVVVDEPSGTYDSDARRWREPAIGPESLAFLQYTSGSTGSPRGVMISHENLIHNSQLIRSCFDSCPESRGVFWLPLFHDMGLIGGVIQTLFCEGMSTLFSPVSFLQRPLRWLETITRTGATVSGGPDFAYDYCVERSTPRQRAGLDLSTWKVAFNGAEPVRAETLDRFAEAFAPVGFRRESFLPCYGLAEATLLVSGKPSGSVPQTLAVDGDSLAEARVVRGTANRRSQVLVSSGKTARDQIVVIVDPETGLSCTEDRVGEIWLSGPSVAKGYWNRPEETQRYFGATLSDHGHLRFLRTGDLGFLRDGNLFVTGRLKDLIILQGRNVYPQDIEGTVERCHPRTRSGGAAAFGAEIDDQERLVVVQEIEREREPAVIEEIFEAVRRAVAEHHDLDVHAIVLIKAHTLPRTSSGKTQRSACKSEFLAGGLESIASWTRPAAAANRPAQQRESHSTPVSSTDSVPKRAAILRWLTERVANEIGSEVDDIDPRRPLASFGMGSVQAVSMAGELEKWLGRPISPVLAYEHPTINAIADALTGVASRVDAPCHDVESRRQAREPIAIIGVGCRFPGATGPDAYWRLIREGIEGIGPVPSSRWPEQVARARGIPHRGGFLDDIARFDASFFGISPREAALIDPQQRLLLEVTWEALENAGQVPSRLAGSLVGVFVGIATSDYAHLQARRGDPGDPYRLTGSAASIAANRISYCLDFRGPSLAVDTACSSSLVAVHLACRSLWEGESTLSVAGGVNLIISPDVVENFVKAGFLASDGRCKAFDAGADGYVRGEGAGMVVLKPLSRAVRDGDPILALIRGSALSQDGRSNGLTAPSREAQEAVLRNAYQDAGVDPGEVDYIEAHGTGTLLGDPVEARAVGSILSKRRDPGLKCAMGSVKTNIGHLEAAAGIAGLIKAALALKHRELPPSLNFREPSPHIDFDGLLLRIPAALEPWPRTGRPAVAGVSSFGFGGTNAHVVLQEPPAPAGPQALRQAIPDQNRLVALSARSTAALRELASSVRERVLSSRGDFGFDDLAHTAGVRREHHDHRLTIVADDLDRFLERLAMYLEGVSHPAVATGRRPASGKPRIAFVFSGQGGLWKSVGCDLFRTLPVFRAMIEDCDRCLSNLAGWSVADALEEPMSESRFSDPAFAQPLQFAVQAALAAVLKSWGIVPDVVVGHSLGEIAAAHFAGALSVDDAARIVAIRGQAMRTAVGRGKMIAAALSPDEARRRLSGRRDLFISAINGPESVTIAGDPETVDAFAAILQEDGHRVRALEVTIAFHSPAMDPARERLGESLQGLKPGALTTRFLSTVTGREASGLELDGAYWARNVREPVLFASAMDLLKDDGVEAVVEIGPHPVLSPSIAACLASGRQTPLILPSLRRGHNGLETLLQSGATLYTRGFDLHWASLAPPGRVVAFPGYPWQRERYWLDDGAGLCEESRHPGHDDGRSEGPGAEIAHPSEPRSEPSEGRSILSSVTAERARDALWRMRWRRQESETGNTANLDGHWLILGDHDGKAMALASHIRSGGGNCTVAGCMEARAGSTTTAQALLARPMNALLQDWIHESKREGSIRGIISLEALDLARRGAENLAAIENGHRELLGRTLQIVQALATSPQETRPRLWIVTRGAQSVDEDREPSCLIQAPLWGMGRSIATEAPELWGGLIDLDPAAPETEVAEMAEVIGTAGSEEQVAFRGSARLVPRLVPCEPTVASGQGLQLRPEGTYLISGGLGELGLRVARFLVERGARRLVLLSRSVLPDRTVWDELPDGTVARARARAIRDLEHQGATVLLAAGDVADASTLSLIIEQLGRTWPPIRGIIHAAGITQPRSLADLNLDLMTETLRPKISGGWLLHELTRTLPLDFFIVFSSIASVLGSPRQLDYGAANAFLDALAHFRRSLNLPAQSINWGPWAEAGMAARSQRSQSLTQIGLAPLPVGRALESLGLITSLDDAQMLAVDAEWSTLGAFHGRGGRNHMLQDAVKSTSIPNALAPDAEWRVNRFRGMTDEDRSRECLETVRRSLGMVLRIPPGDIDENRPLMSLGLDSLTALELRSAIERDLGVALPLTSVLQGSNLGQLAAEVSRLWSDPGAGGSVSAPPPEPRHASTSLSHGQQMLWYAEQYSDAPGAYNIGGAGRIRSSVDARALQRAGDRLIERHESLRTVFPMVEERPQVKVIDRGAGTLHGWQWLFQENIEGWDDSRLTGRLTALASFPFDLEKGSLFRLHLLSRSAVDHVLLIVFHHIVSDFWSLAVFIDELSRLYAAEREGRCLDLEPPACAYFDFAAWQRQMISSDAASQHWLYWSQQLSGDLPVLDIPSDFPRPLIRSARGAVWRLQLDDDLSQAIVALADANGASLYTTLLAAFQVYLARYCGQEDIIIGSPVSGRTRPEWEGLIGYCVNLLPLRGDLSGDPPFDDYLYRVRRVVAEGLEHQDLPFNVLLNRLEVRPDLSRSPLFQVMYIHQKAHRLDDVGLSLFSLGYPGASVNFHGLTIESLAIEKQTTLFDLTLLTARDGDRIVAAFEYRTDLFKRATIERMADGFISMLRAAADHPERRISDLPVAGHLRPVRPGDNAASEQRSAHPRGHVHHRFEELAARLPNETALVFGGKSLSYGELNQKANGLAHRLIAQGVKLETVVGLLADHWPLRIIGLLAILKAGGAYLPLDPAFPRDRLTAMIQDAQASIVLAERQLQASLPRETAKTVSFDAIEIEPVEAGWENPVVELDGANLAYVVFTSGSTGRARGVMVSHDSLLNAADAWEDAYGLRNPPLRHLQAAAFSFDVFTGDWVRALTTGGALVHCPREILLDPGALAGLIRRERIGFLELVPAIAEALASHLAAENEDLPGVRILAMGSDTVSGRLYERLSELVGPEARVVNSYGLTEVTIDSTYFDTLPSREDQQSRLPIGQPMKGTTAYVVDKRLQPVPPGAVGELVLGGRGVARGYASSPRFTAERFIPDPFGGTSGQRLYRTGDLARWRADGNLEYLGRSDRQIKIRGVRVEPGDVEAALGQHPAVSEAVVAARPMAQGQMRLVAYVVPDRGSGTKTTTPPSQTDLRTWLRGRLPEALVPSVVVFIERLPLGSNGKLDHSALPSPDVESGYPDEEDAIPRTAAETILTGITTEILGNSHVGIRENLFELGLDSILGMQLIIKARERGLTLRPSEIFRHPTIADLAAAVEIEPAPWQARSEESPSTAPFQMAPDELDPRGLEETGGTGQIEAIYPLSPVQEGILFHASADPGAGFYVEQFLCRLHGPIDSRIVQESWERLIANHEVLRTAIAWSRASQPCQVVLRNCELPFKFEDLRSLGPEEQRAHMALLLRQDRERGFTPSRPPLMRLALLRTDENVHELIWSAHHLILDGWSLALLTRELTETYSSLSLGLIPAQASRRPFRDFIAWLDRQDHSSAEAYWRKKLQGIASPTALGLDGRSHEYQIPLSQAREDCETSLSESVTSRIEEMVKRAQITLGTLMQGVWALLLSRYSRQDDVTFGLTCAGRPVDLPGSENIVGMFINTIPVRVPVDGDAWLVPWLRNLQSNVAEARRHEATPLSRIQTWSSMPRGLPLFETILIIQNLPFPEDPDARLERLRIESPRYLERTHYPLTVVVIPWRRMHVKFSYDPRRFDASIMDDMVGQFGLLLEAIAVNAERRVGELLMMTNAEQEQLLLEWSRATLTPRTGILDPEFLTEAELDALIGSYGESMEAET